jgi:hypothetical protein
MPHSSAPTTTSLTLQRADARLAAGSYGRSVRSGEVIPTSGWRPTR